MTRDIEAEAAALRRATERAVHLIGCGDVDEVWCLLSAYLSEVSAGRGLLRAYERDSERAARCLREHIGPALAAFMRGEG
jgi:hypothetical protein